MRHLTGLGRSLGCSLSILLASGTAASAQAQGDLPSAPLIRIETGVHSATIKDIAVDRSCKLLVTGSDDRTARLWSAAQGTGAPTLLRTLRPPVAGGDIGKIYTVAMPPDGGLVAIGGWLRNQLHYVLLLDPARGTIITELGPFGSVVNRLAFSRDGRYLAAALGSGKGVRAWERQGAAEWREVLKDEDFNGRDSYGVAFGPDGRLFAVGDDGTLRRYGRSFKREAKISTPGGREPYSVAAHPGGKVLAVGHDDTRAVELYDADSLRLLQAVDVAGVDKGNLSSVAWSADGRRLWAAGRYSVNSVYQVRAWDDEGRGPGVNIATSAANTIRQIVSCGDGIGYVTADPGFGWLDGRGQPVSWVGPVQVDMRGKLGDKLTVSSDGLRVRFGLEYGGGKPAVIDLAAGRLDDAPDPISGLTAPRIDGLDVKDWDGSRTPKFRGQTIKLREYEESRSLAIAPDAGRFVLGTNWNLRLFAADGKERWSKATPGYAWGVNVTAGNRVVVAALADGTLRWFRLSDGQELLALFVHFKDRRWVAWTPQGYYMASDKGDELIGWHQNRGWSNAAEFTFAHERREQYRRPDIVRRVIELADEDRAIAAAGKRK